MYTLDALQVLVFLIPGFIASTVLNALVVRRPRNEFGRIVEALMFTLGVCAIYAGSGFDAPVSLVLTEGPDRVEFKGERPASKEVTGVAAVSKRSFAFNAKGFFLLFGLSVAVPIALAAAINRDLLMKVARALRITDRTARDNVWHDVFTDKREGYIVVHLEGGERLCGWPEYRSDNPDEGLVFLEDAAWIDDSNKYVNLDTQGILLTPANKIRFIEFLKPHREEKKE